jgi:SAM-dependent methyltransferase
MQIIPLNKIYEEHGRKVFDWYCQFGIKPESVFLDVGCCTLSPGIHFIRYLNKGNYFGFDKEPKAIKIAQQEVKKRGLDSKSPVLWVSENSDMSPVTKKIDFVLANSVISHCNVDTTVQIITSIKGALNQKAKLIFTFHESKKKDVVVGAKHPDRKIGNEFAKVEYTRTFLSNVLKEHGYVLDRVVSTVNPTQNAICFSLSP